MGARARQRCRLRSGFPLIIVGALLGWTQPSSADGEVFMRIEPDGSYTFTDSPTDLTGFVSWDDLMEGRPRQLVPIDPRLLSAGIHRFDQEILTAAWDAGIEPELLKAVVLVESGFNPLAVSPAGAMGLCQLMPQTASRLNVGDPFDPVENLRGGAQYLRKMMDRFGAVNLALAAYNAGPSRVERAGGVPNIEETRYYVDKVLQYHRYFRGRPLKGVP